MARARSRLGRGFRRIWTAAAISNVGDGLILAALPLLAESLTKTAVLISGIVSMRYAAWLLLGLFGGIVADRTDRRRVMVVVDVVRAVVVAALGVAVLVGTPPVALLWVAAFLLGCGEVFFDSASQAMLPAVVGDDALLEKANSRLYATTAVGTELVGPPIGALLFGITVSLPFFLDAGSFLVASLIVLSLAGSFRPRRVTTKAPDGTDGRPTVRADLGEAWRYLRNHRLLRSLVALGCAWNFFATGAEATNVVFARRVLHVSAAGYGFVLTGFAVGGVLAGVFTDRISTRIGPGTTILSTFALGGAAGLLSAVSQNAVVFAIGYAMAFAAGTAASIVVVSLRQQLVPDALRGRITAFFRVAIFVSAGLGAAVMGIVDTALSLRAPLLFLGVAGIALFVGALTEVSDARIYAARRAVGVGVD
jgi:MFS family permease